MTRGHAGKHREKGGGGGRGGRERVRGRMGQEGVEERKVG